MRGLAKRIPFSVHRGWNHHWNHPIDQADNRYRKFWTSLTKAISNCNETWKIGKDKINKLLTAKVIQGSWSSWSGPFIVVPKGDRGKHLVINYHALNKITRKFIGPMPKVEDIFSQLNGMKYFSTLDLQAGCKHIPLVESSLPKTAFTSPLGKYEYIKVPFGLTQAPAYFQELMTGVFKDFPFAMAYLDDIIIFSRNAEKHFDHIRQVFKKLQNA